MSAIGRYSVLNILLFRYRISLVSAGRTQGVNRPTKRRFSARRGWRPRQHHTVLLLILVLLLLILHNETDHTADLINTAHSETNVEKTPETDSTRRQQRSEMTSSLLHLMKLTRSEMTSSLLHLMKLTLNRKARQDEKDDVSTTEDKRNDHVSTAHSENVITQ